MRRPEISEHGSSQSFLLYYYLKDEMVSFLRDNDLPVSGSKETLKRRIADFIDNAGVSGALQEQNCKRFRSAQGGRRSGSTAAVICDDAPIGEGFVCSEAARAYFVSRLGSSFSFKVAFQKWLKNNPEATFSDACTAYRKIASACKDMRRRGLATAIDPQFEYNSYIRAFFADNPGRTLADAIKCWNNKKSLPGPHKYGPEDTAALDKE